MRLIKKIISYIVRNNQTLFLISLLFKQRITKEKRSIDEIHEQHRKKTSSKQVAIDLGCGKKPKNLFNAEKCYGIDLTENKNESN